MLERIRAAIKAFRNPNPCPLPPTSNQLQGVLSKGEYPPLQRLSIVPSPGTPVLYVGQRMTEKPYLVVGVDPYDEEKRRAIIYGPPYSEQRLRCVHCTNLKMKE